MPPRKNHYHPHESGFSYWLIGFLVCAAIGLVAVFAHTLSKPDVIMLLPEGGAEWICHDTPLDLRARDMGMRKATFRTTLDVKEVSGEIPFFYKVLKLADIRIEGRGGFSSGVSEDAWNETRCEDLAQWLVPGRHVMYIDVYTSGDHHPAMLAWCPALNLSTPSGWEATLDGDTWTSARPVDQPRHFPISREFKRTDEALLSKAVVFAPVFLVFFALTFYISRRERSFRGPIPVPSPGMVRWIMIAAWTALAVNNIGKVPQYLGMDLTGHLEYIQYIAEQGKLPLAPEGFKMAEPPLFYMLSAFIYSIASSFFTHDWVFRILRVLPLLCGILQIELCYRALRHVFFDRQDLQRLGVIVGGLLPVNLYICQVVGNEPLTGCLTAMAMVCGLRLITSKREQPLKAYATLGVVLGLALLTKLTPILMLMLIVFFLVLAHVAKQGLNNSEQNLEKLRPSLGKASRSRIELRIGVMLVVVVFVAGWFYLRNKIELGSFVISGWDPENGFPWWQDPGYRTMSHFLRFGEALIHPVNSSLQGVWDSLYSTFWADGSLSGSLTREFGPPWNFDFMLAGIWLSLVPALAIGVGIVVALIGFVRPKSTIRQNPSSKKQHPKKPDQDSPESDDPNPMDQVSKNLGLGFAAVCVLLYISAVLYMFLILPVYSTGKATYTSGLTPCYAILCALGFSVVTRWPLIRSILYGLLACWAICVFSAFFVVDAPRDGRSDFFLGELMAEQGRLDEAAYYYKLAIDENPEMTGAYNGLGSQLVRKGKFKEAVKQFQEAIRISPDNAEVHNNLGATLIYMKRFDEARKHLEEAIRLKPDYEKAKQNLKNLK